MQQVVDKLNEIFIMTKGGVTIFYHNFGFEGLDKDLLSGLLTSLNMFASQITGNELKHLEISDHQFCLFTFDPFTLVLHTDKDCCREEINGIAKEISQAFTLKYGTFTENNLILEQFDSFSQDLYAILPIEDSKRPKTCVKSSELLANFLGLTNKKINMKKVLKNL